MPFRVEAGLPDGCRGTVRALWPRDRPLPPTGADVRMHGRWEARDFPEPGRAEWAGRVRFLPPAASAPTPPASMETDPTPPDGRGSIEAAGGGDPEIRTKGGGGPVVRVLSLRGQVSERISILWGERAPMVEALVLARREHLDPELRGAFGLSGTAHLLAISGFHVGVVAGLLLTFLRMAGLRPRPAAIGAAAGSWLYVLAIGAPDAALRASVLLSLLALSRLRGTPVVSIGTLSSAFLLLLAFEPRSLGSVGFQLSFAGTAGLVLLRRPLERGLDRLWRRLGRRPPRRRPGAGPGERWLRGSSEGVVAGVAATLPTLPLLAWHFDRVSLVGIPATLAVAPAVALAIPGVGAALLASIPSPGLGAFLAGGTGLVLAFVEAVVRIAARLPGASLWVSRPGLLAGGGGALVSLLCLGRYVGRIRRPARLVFSGIGGLCATLLLPLAPGPATLDLHMVDVGQGDAFLLRLPSGRWIGIDAGPASDSWDAGERRVVPYLRRHGVTRLDLLVLSHPHLDHIGGAGAVLDGVRVQGVLDPAVAVPSRPYLRTLERARARGVSLWTAEKGLVLNRDGVEVRVLHPDRSTWGGVGSDPNDLSVILLVRWGAVALLFTGDAYIASEERILPELPPLSALKVGHHGSRTSTADGLLRETRPDWALIPVGDGNRFGHPHGEVLARLDAHGVPVLRSDRDGSVRLRFRRDGSATIRTGR